MAENRGIRGTPEGRGTTPLSFEFAEGLAEYRGGHVEIAAKWCQRVLDGKKKGARESRAWLVLANVQQHLNHPEAARHGLAKSRGLVAKLPKLDSGNHGTDFYGVIIANQVEREASMLIELRHAARGRLRRSSAVPQHVSYGKARQACAHPSALLGA